MDYSIGFVDEDGTYSDMRNFEKIPVTKEMLAVTDTKEGKKTTLQVDENGDGRFEKVYSAKKNSTAVEVSKKIRKSAGSNRNCCTFMDDFESSCGTETGKIKSIL